MNQIEEKLIEVLLWSESLEGYEVSKEDSLQLLNEWDLFESKVGHLFESDQKRSLAIHHFILTRNGHGVGFLDGDWGEDGFTLQDEAKKFNNIDVISYKRNKADLIFYT